MALRLLQGLGKSLASHWVSTVAWERVERLADDKLKTFPVSLLGLPPRISQMFRVCSPHEHNFPHP